MGRQDAGNAAIAHSPEHDRASLVGEVARAAGGGELAVRRQIDRSVQAQVLWLAESLNRRKVGGGQ